MTKKTPDAREKTGPETIDISQEAQDLGEASGGNLERLEQESNIENRNRKEKAVVWLSATVIGALLFFCIGNIIWSTDPDTQDWSRQVLSTLVGFAAVAVWKSTS